MSAITHCPACSAAFKVTPEQLQLADGWVRCGRCGEVFEAVPASTTVPASVSTTTTTTTTTPLAMPSVQAPDTDAVAAIAFNRWTVVSACLMLVLIWQAVLSQRHALVAEEPALASVLKALCVPVACEVEWPLEPESVLIDSSSFNESTEGGYNLQLRFKNTQHHPVATPALELSLTDLQDQVLVRRVFTRSELGLRDALPALRETRASLDFDLAPQVKERVAGYRALIFYP